MWKACYCNGMTTVTPEQLSLLRSTLKTALETVDSILDQLSEDPEGADARLLAAVDRAARQVLTDLPDSTAYYLYLRMQRKLEAEGFGHVKRVVITSLLLHQGWGRERRSHGIVWTPPTGS